MRDKGRVKGRIDGVHDVYTVYIYSIRYTIIISRNQLEAKTMDKLGVYTAKDFMGDHTHDDWYIFLCRTRDSNPIEESNFSVGLQSLGGESNNVVIIRHSHWLCGWIEFIIISPDAVSIIKQAEKLLAELEDYPILDEDNLWDREQELAERIWRDYYTVQERIDNIRNRQLDFYFGSFKELISCVRGKSYPGSHDIIY